MVFNKLIQSSKHGFMKHISCTANLLEFLEKATRRVNEGISVDVIYLDCSKAFDKVPKHKLLEKIKAHSTQGTEQS